MSTSRGLPKNNGSASPIVVAATFKILVLGNSDVGKSSLIQKYTTGRVTKSLLPTVGEWLVGQLWVSGYSESNVCRPKYTVASQRLYASC